MADQLTEEQIAEYKQAFFPYDIDGEGTIQSKDLSAVLNSLGKNPSKAEIEDMLNELNTTIDGTIDFPEFLSLLAHSCTFNESSVEDDFIEACKQFDKLGVGTISKDQMRDVITKIGQNITDQEVNELLNDANVDGNGNIDYEAYLLILMPK